LFRSEESKFRKQIIRALTKKSPGEKGTDENLTWHSINIYLPLFQVILYAYYLIELGISTDIISIDISLGMQVGKSSESLNK